MRRGLEWYKREPRAFLDGIRAARMTERQAVIYGIVIDLIYDHGGETPDDPKHIASYLSDLGTAAVRHTIQQLVDMGKVFRVGDMLAAPDYRPTFDRPAIPAGVKLLVLARDGDTCTYCGTTSGPFEFDHVLPWSRGGGHGPDNLVVACRYCNRSKKDRTPSEMGWLL